MKMNNSDLFDNPMIQRARAALSPEQLAEYEAIGEEMYNTVDFEKNIILNNEQDPLTEPYAFILEMLKSGLQPSDLDDNEQQIMDQMEGKDWMKKYNIE